MKMYQIYVCEVCGKESRSHDEIMLCEAQHLGLKSIKEKESYDSLVSGVKYFKSLLDDHYANVEKLPEIETSYNTALKELNKFESEHGMVKGETKMTLPEIREEICEKLKNVEVRSHAEIRSRKVFDERMEVLNSTLETVEQGIEQYNDQTLIELGCRIRQSIRVMELAESCGIVCEP